MATAIFIANFVAVTAIYLFLLSGGRYLASRFENTPLTMQQAIGSLVGTHVGRLRFLLIASVVSGVLTMVYPGPALLLPSGSAEKVREVGHHILYGNDPQHPFVPSPPDTSTWFWGQVTLICVGAFVVYLLLAVPNIVSAAAKAARSVSLAHTGLSSKSFFWPAVVAFAGVIIMFLRNRKST